MWDNNGSCVRLRPTHANHVWRWDLASHCTHDERSVCQLNLIDEYTRKSLAVLPRRRWSSAQVIEVVATLCWSMAGRNTYV